MKKNRLLLLLLIFAAAIAPLLITSPCLANSAEAPSIIIIVENAPKDLEIVLEPAGIMAHRTNKTIESYFTIYNRDLTNSWRYTFNVTTGGKSFDVTIDFPPEKYNNIYTLNLATETLTPGTSLSRNIALITLRVSLTLLIEGIVFFLFGYRTKRSWITFLAANLITQGFLNVWLSANPQPFNEYIIFNLIGGEILVFTFELIAFLTVVNEKSRGITLAYVMAANFLSLILGGWLITVLPI